MKKMGLFGGTFDPIHQGHIDMALMLAQALSLDGVVLMPTFVPPHKIKEQMAPAEDRLAMCRLAAKQHPLLQVSDMELRRGGASFTVDTLEELHRLYPDTQWYLFTGADMFCTLRTWHRFEDIARLATLCTIPREGTDTAALLTYADTLKADGIDCYVGDRPVAPVSSTAVRHRAAVGESLDGLVPGEVAAYIREHGLYKQAETMTRQTSNQQYIEILRTRLGEYRFHHSLCVADEAARLAARYGGNIHQAYAAGLLHDIMKDTSPNAQLQILKDFGILLDEVEQQSQKLWHARSGEAFLRHILQVPDEDILRAVRYHTTGRAGMSLLEKVLFVADFTSADRDYPDVEVMRRLADSSLEEAMQYGIAYTIRELLEKGCAVHPDTVAAYNDIVLSVPKGGQNHEKE